MRKLLLVLAVAAVAGCGDDKDASPGPRVATPTAAPTYSEAILNFYGDPPPPPSAGLEAEYHQPPKPLEAQLGEPITLTGTNIGVRLVVTPTVVEPVGSDVAVRFVLENTGIAVYDAPLENVRLTFADGSSSGPVKDAEADCAKGWEQNLRVDGGVKDEGCFVFRGEDPTQLQVALETVPVEAGGIWDLSAR